MTSIAELRRIKLKEAKNGYRVYFIKSYKHIKVGRAKDPETRLKELQTGNQYVLKLLATLPETFITEAEFHRLLKNNNVKCRGEWFEECPFLTELVDYVKRYNDFEREVEVLGNRLVERYDIVSVRKVKKPPPPPPNLLVGLRELPPKKKRVSLMDAFKDDIDEWGALEPDP